MCLFIHSSIATELEYETGMHARITQSHMEMQITDSYRAVGLFAAD